MRTGISLASSMLVFLGAAAFAHPKHADHLENAQVLPADTPKEEVTALMKHFAQSLGVRCSHCHVGEEGQPLSTYDFASDAKPAKRRARQMLEYTHMLNQDPRLPGEERASLTDMSENRVNCYTCHRGELTPATVIPQPGASDAS
ncbi:c-type cytochrome [Sphingomicrobium clamense]|uniref:C-type cytochrome n=1 Tax=Sphingomicrobium clamense TaxID=2851013 RepID=A0ABS6V6H8_9SPHN|nr:c-type cytochrome [Sphingomicrobium sp. B8]MBW0144668.1 c-type cytochrome [Sphingomicrobium sp. B8]